MLSSNERLLLAASKRGAAEICRHLTLDEKLSLEVSNEASKTPLLLACEEGHLDVVELLLSRGANVHAKDPVGMTPLHLAAWIGNKKIAQALLARDAAVNAQNNIGQTPLHGAALCAHYQLVCILLKNGANPNIQSMARQRIPLHEVGQRQDKPKERLKIHQLLLQCSPDTLYTIFFCKHNSNDLADWFGRMINVIRDVNDCRVFYTIVKTSMTLCLLTSSQALDFAEGAFDQCAEYCVTKEDWRVLWILLNKAHIEDQLVRPQFYQMMQDYYKRQKLERRVVSLDLQVSVRRGIRLLQAGVDGNISTLKTCFMFFLQSMKGLSPKLPDSVRVRNKRIDALVGVVGTLLNAILLGRHTHDHCFRKLLARSVDMLDPIHLDDCMTRDFPGVQRDSLQTAMNVGIKAGRKVWEEGEHQWHFDDAISREDGLVIVGLCAGALGRTLQDDSNGEDLETRSVGSETSKNSTYTTLTIAKSVFREDTFLSPDEEDILKVHKAVKYCDSKLLNEALQVALRDDAINAVDSVGRTALDLAALTGQIDLFEKIRSEGGKPSYFKSESTVAQIVKARSKHLDIYKTTVRDEGSSGAQEVFKDEGTADTQSVSFP